MLVWGITEEDLRNVVEMVSNLYYDGNVTFNRAPQGDGRALRFTLKVRNCRGPGHSLGRVSYSTERLRRLSSACWHVHRDIMLGVYAYNPEARIKSAAADYKNAIDFEAKHRATRGNMRCDCSDRGSFDFAKVTGKTQEREERAGDGVDGWPSDPWRYHGQGDGTPLLEPDKLQALFNETQERYERLARAARSAERTRAVGWEDEYRLYEENIERGNA